MALSRKRGTKAIGKAPGRGVWVACPRLVGLEDRTVPATGKWVGDVDALWATNTAGNTNWFNVTAGTDTYIPVNGDDLLFVDLAVGNFPKTDDLAALTSIASALVVQTG